jgi:hypothetical protein
MTEKYIAVNSAKLSVTTTAASITMYNDSGIEFKPVYLVTNTGSNGAYITFSRPDNIVNATVSSSTPSTTSLYVAAGSIQTFGAFAGRYVISAITASSTTTLEISVGKGE